MKRYIGYLRHAMEMFKYFALSLIHGRNLKLVIDNSNKIRQGDLLLFCTLRNESKRIKYFIEYYKNLGVDHFIFVDNDSEDNFKEIIKKYSDITVYHTSASYKKSNFGMHWLNFLLRKHGNNHWCLTCDPDEFLVVPNEDERSISRLVNYLDETARRSFFTIMIDMYGKDSPSNTFYTEGMDPLSICKFYDKEGYFFTENPEMNSLWIQGGVRMRKLYKKQPYKAPALNKTPLVKWKWYYSYISSMHTLLPRRLNGGYKYSLTGALLHFKYVSLLIEKVEEEQVRKQHYGNSSEYQGYKTFLDEEFYHEFISQEYRDYKDLLDSGLITNREWL